ncbi:unnamed protein product [Phaeothamnion confervicola]
MAAVATLKVAVTQPVVGCPLVPEAELEHADGGTEWEWLRQEPPAALAAPAAASEEGKGQEGSSSSSSSAAAGNGRKSAAAASAATAADYAAVTLAESDAPAVTLVGSSRLYVPGPEDIGCLLRVRCTPISGDGRRGRPAAYFLLTAVAAGWPPALLALRGALTATPLAPPGMRLVSYNVLADKYCTGRFADQQLYPYCPRRYREMSHRAPLILQELLGYNADVVCLQECDAKLFKKVLQPVFAAKVLCFFPSFLFSGCVDISVLYEFVLFVSFSC